MAYNIFIPVVNPMHITQENFANLPQYKSKHFQDWQFEETIRSHEQYVEWYQPWQINDPIRFQIHSQLGPIVVHVIDVTGQIVLIQSMPKVAQDFFDILKGIYQISIATNSIPEGFYRIRFLIGSPAVVFLTTNWFELRTLFEETLWIDYSHYRPHEDAYFTHTNWQPGIRTYGALVPEKPGSIATIFEDQESDMELLDNKSFETHRWYTGGPEGIPFWAISKYNKIAGCSTLKIDGRLWTKATTGTSFEEKEEKDYPMRGWSIELRDKLNRSAKIIEVDDSVVQNNIGIIVVGNTDSKGFVNDDNGGSFTEVSDIQ